MNDMDPPQALQDDQCVLVENAEFYLSTIGERRKGMDTISIAGSGLGDEDGIVFLTAHLPTAGTPLDSELWAVAATLNSSVTISHRVSLVWSDVVPVDPLDNTSGIVTQIQALSIHGKLFLAYRSADGTNRLHVWDGTTLRRTGLAAPTDAPTAGNEGSGSFSGDRTYRVRVILKDGSGKILLRSEPSPEVTFSPSGSGAGVTVTAPTFPGEVETHWELEASDGDGFFYRIATEPIATTTYNDETDPATDYATFPLSDAIGEYNLIPSIKYLVPDQDRIIFATEWDQDEFSAMVGWTPVYNNPLVGNDERFPANFDSFVNLDWADGGGVTGLSKPQNGSFYAFKWQRIYKMQRTGVATNAYESFLISDSRGAIPGSIVNAIDELGRPCVYFIDPFIGPSRLSTGGVQQVWGFGTTWRHVNTASQHIICRGVFYPDKKQVKWWVAYNGSETPTHMICVQTNEQTVTNRGAERGLFVATGDIATAWTACILPERVENETNVSLMSNRVLIGMEAPNYIQRTDVGDTDNGTEYVATIRTKPFILNTLLNRFGGMVAALLATADDTVGVLVRLIRDMGKETHTVETDLEAEGSETMVVKLLDDLNMSETTLLQVEFTDIPS